MYYESSVRLPFWTHRRSFNSWAQIKWMTRKMSFLNHIATLADKCGARRLAERIWLRLRNSPKPATSSVAYQSLGERYMRESRYAEALSLYQESMAKLKDTTGDGRQCYAANLVCAASAAIELNRPELAKRYLDEAFDLEEIEDWVLDWARRKLLVLPRNQKQQEGAQPEN